MLTLLAPLFLLAASDGLPRPTGVLPVGTRIHSLVDPARHAPGHEGEGRPVVVQLWYPAVAKSGTRPAPYLPDPSLVELMVDQGYYEQAEADLRAWGALDTHARLDAEFATDGPLPLLLLSHGLGVSRANYTALATDLASRGFAVATLDHPGGGLVVTGDGAVLSTEDDPGLEEHFETRALEWVDDFRFVLDALTELYGPKVLRLDRVGVLGHSMGGSAALAAGGRDPRIAACLDLDGAPLSCTEREGLRRPSLFVKSQPVRAGEPLVGRGLPGQDDPAGRAWEAIRAHTSAPALYVSFAGTGHMSFSDAPFVMPNTITRFGGQLVSFERAQALLVRLVSAFFDVHLRGASESLLLALGEEPELVLTPLGTKR